MRATDINYEDLYIMNPFPHSVLKAVTVITSVFIIAVLTPCAAVFAHTAPNFSLKDCNNADHDLYTDINAGKVVVIVWVMPCGACALPTLTTSGVVKDIDKNYPGKVKLYIIDDFGDTECSSLRGWLKNYSISYTATYVVVGSSPDIPMTNYGAIGMPKIIAVGGGEKNIIYNSENDVDAFVLRDKIVEQLSTSSVEITSDTPRVSPNPVNDIVTIHMPDFSAESIIVIHNARGEEVMTRFNAQSGGDVSLNTADLPSGLYAVCITVGGMTRSTSFFKT